MTDNLKASLPARRSVAHGSEILATSYALPSQRVDNDEFFRRCQFTPTSSKAELVAETAMKQRYWCAPEENTRSLAEAAVAALMRENPDLAGEVDVVVVASGTTMTMAHPSDPHNRAFADLAPLLLRQLGRTDALGLDIKACYCTGFLRGMQVVDGLLANPNYRTALLVAVEQGSRFATAASNRSSFCFIVADGAGAVVFRRTEPSSVSGIIDYCGYSAVDKLDWVGIGADAASIIMLGSRAASATLEMLVECAHTLLHRNGLTARDVDFLIPIQTHRGLLSELTRTLEWPENKLLWAGDELGFSGSASIPTCLAQNRANGRLRKGQSVLSLAVGAGMNCAGALYFA
ncbi:MAG TPA: 3-oxoacyl-[acyl-carrier-protein] synthase III C-terminal domain-containing protein [Polyangiaceae bacterium]|nr:3-oxoacyl-[acyl-carrier-protein] synthase III C-terminal domain-containing protein [Polyangiaceae bacterium]